jgi:thioredoxin-dependent peroxiredoxin
MYRMRGKVDAGDRAPEFKARSVQGREIDNAAFTGRSNLVLFFYRNSRCQTCREELTDMAKKYDYIVQQDGEVFAISTDGIDVAKNMAIDLHLPFNVISDPNGDIIKKYGVYDNDMDTAYPAVFLIDKNGVVRHRKIISGLDDLVPADEIVNRLRGMGTPHGENVFQSFRYK